MANFVWMDDIAQRLDTALTEIKAVGVRAGERRAVEARALHTVRCAHHEIVALKSELAGRVDALAKATAAMNKLADALESARAEAKMSREAAVSYTAATRRLAAIRAQARDGGTVAKVLDAVQELYSGDATAAEIAAGELESRGKFDGVSEVSLDGEGGYFLHDELKKPARNTPTADGYARRA